ncbi:MAG: hypothetical protein Q4A86_05120, partial [Clostridia bacterium]|nr:hypothetical protein [Clostridia bacterium]
VPDDLTITDAKEFKVVTGGVNNSDKFNVKAYDENDVNYSPAVVCYKPSGSGATTVGTLFLVGEVTKCIIDDEEAYKVKGLYDNQERECYVTAETMKDCIDPRKDVLEPGDIFTCNINDSGYITAFTMRYNVDDRYNYESGLPYNMNWLTENYYMTATVRKVDDIFFRLAYGWREDDKLTDDFINSTENIVTQQSWARIYVFDQKSGKYRIGSLGDFKGYDDFGTDASRVYVYFNWGQCACVIVENLE